MKFQLGQELKDIVTGFQGIVMVRSEYFTGCTHYGLQAKSLTPEGKVREWEYFDETRLVLVDKKKIFEQENEPVKCTSGPGNNPPQIG